MAYLNEFDPVAFLKTRLNGALESQLSLAVANVKRLRRVHHDKTLAELIAYMDKFYFGAAVIAGATQGAAAAGANTAMQAAVVDLPASFEASVLYALSVAGIQGLDPEDIERRTLLMLVALVEDFFGNCDHGTADRSHGPTRAKKVVQTIRMSMISKVNNILDPRFVTKRGTKQGALVLGTLVPASSESLSVELGKVRSAGV